MYFIVFTLARNFFGYKFQLMKIICSSMVIYNINKMPKSLERLSKNYAEYRYQIYEFIC